MATWFRVIQWIMLFLEAVSILPTNKFLHKETGLCFTLKLRH